MTAPIVDEIIDPSQPETEEIFKNSKSQFPTNPPAIPKRIFNSIPADFDLVITPASQPATAPIRIEIIKPILFF